MLPSNLALFVGHTIGDDGQFSNDWKYIIYHKNTPLISIVASVEGYTSAEEAQFYAVKRAREILEQDLQALPKQLLAEQAFWLIKDTGEPVTRKVVGEDIPEIDYLELTLTNYPFVRFEVGQIEGADDAFVTVHDKGKDEPVLLNNHCRYGHVEILVDAMRGYLDLEFATNEKTRDC